MRLGHAAIAAFVLAGWYLIVPPTGREYPMGKVDAPLTEWVRRPTIYRSKDECEHVLDREQRLTNSRNRQLLLRYRKQAQCVSTDDPRLKGK
jgi:hypothetical protein